MLRSCRIAVVVPAYNEAALIEPTLRVIPAFVDEIVVVDDGSTDGTVARANMLDDPRVRVVQHASNRGVGAAIRTGYEAVFSGPAEIAVVMAGDAQMDPEDLKELVAPLLSGSKDFVKGDRLSHPALQCMPLKRRIGNHVLTWLTRLVTGLQVRDSQCGYTAMNRSAFIRLSAQGWWPRYGYPNDMLGRIAETNLRMGQCTVRPIYGLEKSGVRWWHAALVVPLLLLRVAGRRAVGALRTWSSDGRTVSAHESSLWPRTRETENDPRLL